MSVRRAVIIGCLIDLSGALLLALIGGSGVVAVAAGIVISVGSALLVLAAFVHHWQSDPRFQVDEVGAEGLEGECGVEHPRILAG